MILFPESNLFIYLVKCLKMANIAYLKKKREKGTMKQQLVP